MPGIPAPVIPWNFLGNYPVGSNLWNGNPLGLAPAGMYFTPNTKPAAEEFNYLFGTRDAARDLMRNALAGVAQDWHQEFTITTNFSGGYNLSVDWDSVNGLWLMSGSQGTNVYLYYTKGLDEDQRWAKVGGASFTTNVTAMCAAMDPNHPGTPATGSYIVATANDDGTHNGTISIWTCAAGLWGVTPTTFGMSAGLTSVQTLHMATIGTKLVLGIGNTDANGSGLKVWNGAAWSSYSIPGIGGGVIPEIKFASNGTTLIAMCCGTSNFSQNYTSTTDGITWTARTNDLPLWLSTYVCVGVTYTADIQGPCFLAAFYNTATSSMVFLRSSDGLQNWTTASAPATAFHVTDIAACGSLIFGPLADNGSGGVTGMVFSPDGGVTWYGSSETLYSAAANTNSYYIAPRVTSNGLRVCNFHNLWTRFSLQCGTPLLSL